jgi:septum formation protein
VRRRSSSPTSEPGTLSGQLILASGSPQRRAILEQLGVSFEVVVSNVDELEAGPPEEVALENAFRKARAVADGLAARAADGLAARAADGLAAGTVSPNGRYSAQNVHQVLGVDTVVALGATVYGKPTDAAHARETLERLNGRSHRVISGICVIDHLNGAERVRSAAGATEVTFRRVDAPFLSWYIATGEWEGRAGGYAIQGRGAALVERIEGDYLNVVGLPVPTLLDLVPDLVQ